MRIGKIAAVVAAAALVGSALAPLAAHGESDKKERFAESQYRHDVMEHFSYGFKKIGAISKKKAGKTEHIAAIANIMANAATMTKDAFEKDTRAMEGFTKSKDSIWENWDDFAMRLDKLEVDAAAFAEAAKSGDMAIIGPAMGAVGKNCKSCHDEYKEE